VVLGKESNVEAGCESDLWSDRKSDNFFVIEVEVVIIFFLIL
jgi:hypothetical protein